VSYVINATGDASRFREDAIKSYRLAHSVTSENDVIERCFYLDGVDKIMTTSTQSQKHFFKIIDPHTRQTKAVVTGHSGAILAATSVPSHKYIATSDLSNTISFWDVFEYKKRQCLPTKEAHTVLQWDSKHSVLYSGTITGKIHAWDVCSLQARSPPVVGHCDVIMDLLNLNSMDRVASCSLDGKICLWDNESMTLRKTLTGHTKGICKMAYTNEHRFLVSAGFDHDALVWNPYVDTLICPLKGHTSSIVHVEIPEYSPEIITTDCTGIVKVWDIRNFQCVQTMNDKLLATDYDDRVTNMAYCDTNPTFFVTTLRGLHVYDVDKPADPHLSDELPLTAVLLNTSSLTFLTAGGRKVKIWDAKSGCLLRIHKGICETEITAACLDASCRRFIVGDHSGGIFVHNYSNGSLMKALTKHAKEITALHYVPNEKVLISTSLDGFVKLHSDSIEEGIQVLRSLHMDNVNKRVVQWKPVRDPVPNPIPIKKVQSLWNAGAAKTVKSNGRRRHSSMDVAKAKAKRKTASEAPVEDALPGSTSHLPLSSHLPLQKTVGQKQWANLASAHKLGKKPNIAKLTQNLVKKQHDDASRLITDFDITVMAFSQELGIIATTGPSQAVCMWDYQTCHYLSVSFGHNDVVTSLDFMYPRLGLMSVDEEGWVYCWRVRPVAAHGQCWFKFNMAPTLKAEIRDRNAYVDAVTSIKWWDFDSKLVAADEAGCMRIWALTNADHIDTYVSQKKMLAIRPGGRATVHGTRDDGMVLKMATSWKAHSDRICEMRLIKEPVLNSCEKEPIIVTTSFDCHTYIWTMAGERLGSFNQGVSTNANISVRTSWWKLNVDTEMDRKRQMNEAEHVLASLRESKMISAGENVAGFNTAKRALESLNFDGKETTTKDLRTFLASIMQRKVATPSRVVDPKVCVWS
jgi:WD40 repeat protein